jgi:hypothetical protein
MGEAMSSVSAPCNCDYSLRLAAELGETGLLLANARDELVKRDTERAPAHPGEVSEFAVVRSINWTLGLVTVELKLPHSLEELPSVDDEVRVAWLVPEAT